jgi:hypothetical protein
MRGGVLASVGLVLVAASLPAAAATGPSLGAARSFAALGSTTVTSTGLTVITGDVGVSPGTAITGFPPATVTGGSIHANDATAIQAHADAALAYGTLEGLSSIPANNRSGTDLGGLTLAPGVYKFNSSAQLTGNLTLDAGGDSGALFVFQIGSTLTTASDSSVVVINGGADYDESHVFWQVGSSATLASGTVFTGNILAYASITLVTGSTMTGNALALNGGVTMESNTITSPALVVPAIDAPTAPSSLTAAPIGGVAGTGSNLSWTDSSTNETVFRVFRRDGDGSPFVLVGSTATTNMAGAGGTATYQDVILNSSTIFTYRVTALSAADGESLSSNEVIVPAAGGGVSRLDITLGRGRSVVRDRSRAHKDSVLIKGAYTVTGTDTFDPRTVGVTVQVRAPGNMAVLTIPANDPNWKASKNGVYRWRTRDGGHSPASSIRIDTKKAEFVFKSDRNDFGSIPVNSITVSFNYQNLTGSDTRVWDFPTKAPAHTRALFTTVN